MEFPEGQLNFPVSPSQMYSKKGNIEVFKVYSTLYLIFYINRVNMLPSHFITPSFRQQLIRHVLTKFDFSQQAHSSDTDRNLVDCSTDFRIFPS